MTKSNYEFDILVNGKSVREYWHNSKLYIEGRNGQSFQLRIRNNGYKRILAVPTVDGLSVLDGKPATTDSTGYIVNGYSTLIVEGWRKNDKEVAEFYFTDSNDSYGVRVGKGGNLGVIGLAVFREKEYVPMVFKTTTYPPMNPFSPPWSVTWMAPSATSGGGGGSGNYESPKADVQSYHASASANVEHASFSARNMDSVQPKDMGTGWGDTLRSEVTSVNFNQEQNPDAIFEIFYNSRENLERLGISLQSQPKYVTSPKAFPNYPSQWCEPPRP